MLNKTIRISKLDILFSLLEYNASVRKTNNFPRVFVENIFFICLQNYFLKCLHRVLNHSVSNTVVNWNYLYCIDILWRLDKMFV